MSIYWYVWFCEEPLTSMEPFHCTKGYYSGKRFVTFKIVLHTEKGFSYKPLTRWFFEII